MNTQDDLPELSMIRDRYTDDDLKKIKQLRNYYRRNFQNGDSDESFLIWLEDGLRVIKEELQS